MEVASARVPAVYVDMASLLFKTANPPVHAGRRNFPSVIMLPSRDLTHVRKAVYPPAEKIIRVGGKRRRELQDAPRRRIVHKVAVAHDPSRITHNPT